MRVNTRTFIATATILALGGTATQAAEVRGSTYLTPMLHGQWHDDARDADDDFDFSVALGHAVHERWNLELSAARGEFDRPGGNGLQINNLGINALFVSYRDGRISPYVLLGAGWAELNPDFGSTEHDPYADTGFGLLVTLHRPADSSSAISLRGDVRARHTFVGNDRRLVDYMAGIGVQLAFGGARGSSAAARKPPQSPIFDSDADGIRDDLDRCPGTPPAARIDGVGCERDSDGDGVLDSRDKCPGSRPGIVADASGCEADTDQDGVLESRDRCPKTPRGDRIDTQGCSLTVRLEVHFEPNSVEIRPESARQLDEAAALLRDVPSIAGIIEGHTDSLGPDRHNLELSQRRAEAVREYLVDKGVAESRLGARGYGESQPIAGNSTPEGRARNRRVVLTRTDQT